MIKTNYFGEILQKFLETLTAILNFKSYYFRKTVGYGNFRTNHSVIFKQRQVFWNLQTFHFILTRMISVKNIYIHNKSKENQCLQRGFKGCLCHLCFAKKYINVRFEEICSRKKLSVDEVIYFVYYVSYNFICQTASTNLKVIWI